MRATVGSSTLLSMLAAGCAEPSWDHAGTLAVAQTARGTFVARLDDAGQLYTGDGAGREAAVGEPGGRDLAVATDGATIVLARSTPAPGDGPLDLEVGALGGPPSQVDRGFVISQPAIALDGDGYVLAWENTGERIELARVSRGGELLRYIPREARIPSRRIVGLVSTGQGAVLAHVGGADQGHAGVYARRFDPEGLPEPAVQLVADAAAAAVAGGEHGIVIVWAAEVAFTRHVLQAQRFDAALAPVGPPLELARFDYDSPFPPRVSVTGDAARFAVAWTTRADYAVTVHARVVDAGAVGEPRRLGAGYYPVVSARAATFHAHWLSDDDVVRSAEL